VIRIHPTIRSHRRVSERGLTLVELLVSLALLAAVSTVVAAAYSVGLKALGPGGAGDRLAGAHDQMVFEQQLGRDVSRASCLQVPPAGPRKYGSCAHGFANPRIASACGNAQLCVGWPQVSDSSCHVAVYTAPGSKFRRSEYSVAPAPSGRVTAVANFGMTTDAVGVVINTPAPAPASLGYAWVASLTVTVTNMGVTGGRPSDKLVLTPLATDPAGSAAAIAADGPPC
jgi:prepilin-type N-terminal cleavage/methylation domain-containing protein